MSYLENVLLKILFFEKGLLLMAMLFYWFYDGVTIMVTIFILSLHNPYVDGICWMLMTLLQVFNGYI